MNIDPSILENCINKDRRAQRALYEACYSYLMSICFRYAKSKDEALEFLNIGFLKILNGLKKKSDVPFKFWIRKIMINSIIDEFRKTKKYKESTILKDYQEEKVDEGLDNVLNDAENKLNVDDIYKMVRQLPPVTQKVFNLYIIDGYNHREVGEMLKMSSGTSKWHLSSARKLLKELIIKNEVILKVV